MTGMPPPTSTDEQGTVIDGTAHSEEWRQKQRAAQRPQTPGSPEATPSVPAADFDPAAAKDFVSSLMIPAKLVRETPQEPATPDAPDAYINTLLDGSREPQPPNEPEVDVGQGSAQSDELDRFFEEQATSLPHAPTAQTLPRGSASLDIETDPEAGAGGARNGRALRLPRAHARENDQRDHRPTARRRLAARVHLTRTRILAGSMLAALSGVAIAIAAGGSPAHHSPISSASRSTSTTFAGLLDTSMSRAGRLPGLERLNVRARRQQPRPSHRTHRPAPRHPIARPDASTGAAHSSPYTARVTSQTDSSPAPTASASTSTRNGGSSSPAASTSSGGSSTPVASSSRQARTGPTGPISLIGAGTTPSG